VWRRSKAKLGGIGLALAVILAPSIVFAATNVQTKICNPFNAPSITAPASGSSTSNSSIHLVGYSSPGTVVNVLKNGSGSGATTAATDGTYGISVPLDTGSNSLVASVTNDCNTIKKSATFQALRVAVATPVTATPTETTTTQATPTIKPTAKPEVTTLTTTPAPIETAASTAAAIETAKQEQAQKEIIAEPRAGDVLSNERTWISGKTTATTKVDIYVNRTVAASVVSADDGIYGAMVNIRSGQNTIQVQATAADGTVITVRTIDVQLVKKEIDDKSETNKDKMKDVHDIAGWIAIGAIGIGGVCVMSFIAWHTHQLRMRRKK
jgi:hypothetical protein